MSSAFIQAAVILLREGLEAMLVIAALAGGVVAMESLHQIYRRACPVFVRPLCRAYTLTNSV